MNAETFGEWLKIQIEAKFGTQQGCSQFSQRIGFPILTVYRWIRNDRTPSGYSLALIVRVLSGEGEESQEAFFQIAGEALDKILNSRVNDG